MNFSILLDIIRQNFREKNYSYKPNRVNPDLKKKIINQDAFFFFLLNHLLLFICPATYSQTMDS